jgi:hypothetical protein
MNKIQSVRRELIEENCREKSLETQLYVCLPLFLLSFDHLTTSHLSAGTTDQENSIPRYLWQVSRISAIFLDSLQVQWRD